MSKALKLAGAAAVALLLVYPGGPRELIWDTQSCVQQYGCTFFGGAVNLNDAADALGEKTGSNLNAF